MTSELQWFAVRTVFRHEVKDGAAVFEEKITMYSASDADAAIELAKQDASDYLAMNETFVQVKRYSVYELGHGAPNLNGVEVWSYLSKGPPDPEQFYHEKHEKFDLSDDETL